MACEIGLAKWDAPAPQGTIRDVLTSRAIRLAACAAWVLFAALPAAAAQWRGTLNLNASETYTDNASLTPAAAAKSDFVTQVSPGFSLRGTGPKLNVSVDYFLQESVYARESDLNRTNHSLAASAKSELAKNWLFIDANASIAQETVSVVGPVGGDNTTSNANRAEVRTFRVSPYVRDRLGSSADYEVRYQYDNVRSDSDILPTSWSNKYSANITSGPAFRTYTWDLKLYKENVYYQQGGDQGQESITGDLRYFLTPLFALTAGTGYEKYDYPFFGDKPEGSFWNGGIFWQPSTLTTLSVSSGKRFFGRVYALDFSHRSRRLLWKASYGENITTTRSNFVIPQTLNTSDYLSALISASISDPVQRAQAVNQLIAQRGLPAALANSVNFFTDQVFLQKRGDASVAYNSAKTTTVLSFFRDVRDSNAIGALGSVLLGQGDFGQSANIRQQGVGLLFNWAFQPRTNADFNIGYSDTLFRDTGQKDRLKFLRLGLRHQLTPKMTGAVDYHYNQRDSTAAEFDYKENAVSASVNVRF